MSGDKKITKQSHQLQPPVFPGGKKGLDEFVKSNLKYPEEALKQKVEGTVHVDYDVDVFGKVLTAKVRHGLGHGCDEEALRIVRMLKFQKRKYPGQHVVFHQKIQIHFRLHSASKPVENAQTINYSYKPKASEAGPTPPSTGYTIRIDL